VYADVSSMSQRRADASLIHLRHLLRQVRHGGRWRAGQSGGVKRVGPGLSRHPLRRAGRGRGLRGPDRGQPACRAPSGQPPVRRADHRRGKAGSAGWSLRLSPARASTQPSGQAPLSVREIHMRPNGLRCSGLSPTEPRERGGSGVICCRPSAAPARRETRPSACAPPQPGPAAAPVRPRRQRRCCPRSRPGR
jgi:hypothetical protein